MRILIVDDEPLVLELLKNYYTEKGAEVEIADDGIECGAKLFDNDYDLILLDICMPNMDGIKTIRYLKEGISKKNREINIIVISAFLEPEIIDLLKEYKIPYFRKPLALNALDNFILKNFSD